MNSIEIIYGKAHEGKTNELVERYVNYCNGKTMIDGKEYKNSDLVKPIFIYGEETLENIIERIKLKDVNFDFTDKMFEDGSKDISETWIKVLEEKNVLVIFLDANVNYIDVPKFIQNVMQYVFVLQSKGLGIDILFTALSPKAL